MSVRFIRFFWLACLLVFAGCSSDDPEPLGTITMVSIDFVNVNDPSDASTASFSNANGQETNVAAVLKSNVTYEVQVSVFDESQSVRATLTSEILNRGNEYRAFIDIGDGEFIPTDRDSNGFPIGLTGTFTASGRSTTTLSFSLFSKFDKATYEARQYMNVREFGTLEFLFSNTLIILP